MKLAQPTLAPLSGCQIPELDNESNSLGLDLVNLAQPPTRPPSPGQSASGQPVLPSQPSTPPNPPLAPPWAPQGSLRPLPGVETSPLQPQSPQYSLHPTKEQLIRGSQAGPSTESINNILIHMFQEVPNSYWNAMDSPDKDIWLQASKE